MGEHLSDVRPDSMTAEQRALYVSITGGPRASGPFPLTNDDGSLGGPFGAMVHAPAVGGALAELGAAIRYRSSLDAREREIAILAVGATRRSEYEIWAHRLVAASMGFPPEEIAALADGSWRSENEVESVVHESAVVLAGGGELPPTLATRLVAALGESGAVELVTLVGYYCTLAMLIQTFQIPSR